jgi:hypothetical protein
LGKSISINGTKVAAPDGALAYKHADPSGDARWIYDEVELLALLREKPSLVVVISEEEAEQDDAVHHSQESGEQVDAAGPRKMTVKEQLAATAKGGAMNPAIRERLREDREARREELAERKEARRQQRHVGRGPRVVVKKFKGERALARGIEEMTRLGYEVQNQASRKALYSATAGVLTRKQIHTVTFVKKDT